MAPESAQSRIVFDRPKGPKVESSAPISGARLASHPNQTLDFADRIIWIDTSSRDYGGVQLHATATILGEPAQRVESHLLLALQRGQGLEFRGEVERPEAFAWAEIIERIRRNPKRLLGMRIVVVVDSDLGRLADINARKVPVWGSYMLPTNFELLYASADVGVGHSALNKLMSACDADSVRLSELAQRTDPKGVLPKELSVVGGPSVRIWNATDQPGQ